MAPRRVFYAAGPGDAIRAHGHWKRGEADPTEVSLTFSGQIEDYCREVRAALHIVAYHGRRETAIDGSTVIEHLPKFWPDARGLVFHVRELVYGLMLLRRALAFRADAAILDSGCTHFFWQGLFALFGMRVVPVLHNALWPNGYKPQKPMAVAVRFLDAIFWRSAPTATLCVSPLCARQVAEVAGPKHRPLIQMRAQFDPDYFARIPPPPPHRQRPFRIMFIGRVVEAKGVFDILTIAAEIERRAPERVRWILCGTGADFEKLRRVRDDLNLQGVVDLKGWTSPEELAAVYAEVHCSIVPTRSAFVEGLAMTAAEAVLAGRPVITNPVVPALELLEKAAVPCRTDDPQSYVDEILKLIDDEARYRSLVANCGEAGKPFLDRRMGLTEALRQALGQALDFGERADRTAIEATETRR